MNEATARIDLAAVHRSFAMEGLNEGTWTHFSCKLGQNGPYLGTYAVPRTNAGEGTEMAAALGDKKVLFIKNHGILIAAGSLTNAAVSVYQLEHACQIQLIAMASGAELDPMGQHHAAQLASEACNGEPDYLDGMKRLLEQTQPDFRK